ncbi:MAG: PEP/pyruvate-binding domain-containing protein [Dehalococcoidia bacterium]
MADLTFDLDHPAARLIANAGGKGASLARMRGAGLPVPSGFVVSTRAFESSGFTLPRDLDDQMASLGLTDMVALEEVSRKARQRLMDTGVPGDVAAAVIQAYERMQPESVAVRSSATAEDMPWASFAGQYDTFLNVVSAQELLDRLLQVWASLYAARAVAYRKRLGIPHNAVSMAVVVQRQLNPVASGVMFTRDPVTGAGDRYLVNAALGIGEGVVTGEVPTDSFALDSNTLAILERRIAQKDTMMAPAPGGGISLEAVPETQRGLPALTDPQLTELARLAQQVTGLFQGPQDIEFAAQEGSIHLLQARAVTGVDDGQEFKVVWEDPADAGYTWARHMGALGREVTTRLQQDSIRAYAGGQETCFQETGSPMAKNYIVRFFNGYPYVRPPDVTDIEQMRRLSRHRDRDQAYRNEGTSLYEAEIQPDVERRLAELQRFRPRGASLPALAGHLEKALKDYGQVMGNLHWRMAGAMQQDWPSTYHQITGEPEVASGTLLQARPNKTTRLVKRLRSLARLVQQDAEIKAVFKEGAYHRLNEAPLRNKPTVRRYRTRFQRLLRDYGLRSGRGFGSEVGFTSPTWNMDPGQPMAIIAFYADQDLDHLDRLDVSARQVRIRAVQRVRRQLAGDPERLQQFEAALPIAVSQVSRMENHNHIMEQGVNGAFREAIYKMGRGLVRERLLDNPDDVIHISMAELRDIAVGAGPRDLRALVKEREAELQHQAGLRPPVTVGSGGPLPTNPLARFDPPPGTGLDGTVLKGVGASPGRVVGRARLVTMRTTLPKVEQGEVLVATNVGPDWTPIFPLLGGLVLDQGAVFQHAALVAREYGIPAVILTRDATSVVTDGQIIEVDADQGIVDLAPST